METKKGAGAPRAAGAPGTTHGKPGNSTAEFLKAIFGSAVPAAFITAFPEDPTGDFDLGIRGRMWAGGTYAEKRGTLTDDANQYICVSTFNPSRDPKDNGRPRRQRVLFARCYGIMVDDIGTKVQTEAIKLSFTALVETSPGNFQGWYALSPKDPDAEDPNKVDYVVDQMISRGLAKVDPGMRGVTRYGRLPGGVNNKRKLGTPFRVVMTELHAGRVYTLRAVAEAYNIDLDDAVPPARTAGLHGARIAIPETEREKYGRALIDALEAAECEPHEHPNKPGGFDVLCPWRATHTNGDTSGTMIFIPGYVDPGTNVEYTLGGFKCHHGHCENKRLRDVLGYLNTEHKAKLSHPAWLTMPPMPPERLIPDEAGLQVNAETGVPRRIQHNLDVILLHDPQYANSAGFQLAFDTFASETFVGFESETVRTKPVHLRAPGRAIPVELSLAVQLDIYRTHRVEFSPAMIDRALEGRLTNNRFDSAMEWAMTAARSWDGMPRIDRWLIEMAGAPDNPYVRAVSERVLVAIAKRAMNPGFKFDYMLILEGAQGIGKSTLLRELAPRTEWYASTHFDVQNKDAVVDSIGKLIIEFEELQALRRVDYPAIKGFLSRTSDRIRLPYERTAQDFPRRVVFIGTTNEATYLRDTSGNRRFWPVKVTGALRLDLLARERDQLWAEAAAKATTITHPTQLSLAKETSDIADREASFRHVAYSDPWMEVIEPILKAELDAHPCAQMNRLLERLGISKAAQTQSEVQRLSAILSAIGMVSVKRRWKAKENATHGWVWEATE